MAEPLKYLDAKTLNRASRLEIKAREIVEGTISGMHKSPFRGYSVEFAQHREYVTGDDLRHIDWKVYGKSDRFYIKEYEEETNLTTTTLLDMSESMAYGDEKRGTKFDYAATIAATMAYLILKQQDQVALALFDEDVQRYVPHSASLSQFRTVVAELAAAVPTRKTKTSEVFAKMANRLVRRGLVIVISDFLEEPEEILRGLSMLRHRKHDVIAFHVLDHDELTFPFERMTRFEGLEEMPKITADPRVLRQAYLEEVEAFTLAMKKGCLKNRIDYVLMDTGTPVDVALTRYLATRMAEASRG
ncbi:MAG: DUF58 domain-containing protein [Planctomycetota bacterium]